MLDCDRVCDIQTHAIGMLHMVLVHIFRLHIPSPRPPPHTTPQLFEQFGKMIRQLDIKPWLESKTQPNHRRYGVSTGGLNACTVCV